MADKIDISRRTLLNGYVEELASVQGSILDLHAELTRLRNDARTDGFNMEAVQILSQIVSKSSHDGGLSLLRDIVKYAHEIGIELDTVAVEAEFDGDGSGSASKEEETYLPHFRAAPMQIHPRLVLLFQLVLGAGVAWMFLSLL